MLKILLDPEEKKRIKKLGELQDEMERYVLLKRELQRWFKYAISNLKFMMLGLAGGIFTVTQKCRAAAPLAVAP